VWKGDERGREMSVGECQTRRVVEGIESISGREVELVVKKKN